MTARDVAHAAVDHTLRLAAALLATAVGLCLLAALVTATLPVIIVSWLAVTLQRPIGHRLSRVLWRVPKPRLRNGAAVGRRGLDLRPDGGLGASG